MAVAPSTYDIGDIVRISAVFTDASGTFTDPATVNITVKNPAGALVSPALTPTQDSAGHYHADLPIPLAGVSSGQWFYRWSSTLAEVGEEGFFYVRISQFY